MANLRISGNKNARGAADTARSEGGSLPVLTGRFSPEPETMGPRFSVSEETGQKFEQKSALCQLILSRLIC